MFKKIFPLIAASLSGNCCCDFFGHKTEDLKQNESYVATHKPSVLTALSDQHDLGHIESPVPNLIKESDSAKKEVLNYKRKESQSEEQDIRRSSVLSDSHNLRHSEVADRNPVRQVEQVVQDKLRHEALPVKDALEDESTEEKSREKDVSEGSLLGEKDQESLDALTQQEGVYSTDLSVKVEEGSILDSSYRVIGDPFDGRNIRQEFYKICGLEFKIENLSLLSAKLPDIPNGSFVFLRYYYILFGIRINLVRLIRVINNGTGGSLFKFQVINLENGKPILATSELEALEESRKINQRLCPRQLGQKSFYAEINGGISGLQEFFKTLHSGSLITGSHLRSGALYLIKQQHYYSFYYSLAKCVDDDNNQYILVDAKGNLADNSIEISCNEETFNTEFKGILMNRSEPSLVEYVKQHAAEFGAEDIPSLLKRELDEKERKVKFADTVDVTVITDKEYVSKVAIGKDTVSRPMNYDTRDKIYWTRDYGRKINIETD